MADLAREDELLELIVSTGAVRNGHFVLTSGRHSDRYVNKDDVSTRPSILEELATEIAGHFWGEDVEVVAAPAIGAIALGNRVAENYGQPVISAFAEPVGEEFVFRRGYDRFIRPGTRVLVVEDIITTGRTTRAMIEAVRKLGGEVVGIGLLWNRSQEEFDIPVFACVNKTLPTYDPIECPLCRDRVSINTEVGHGQKFLDQYGEDPSGWLANKGK